MREADVGQSKLVLEPAGRMPPVGERDEVDVDEPKGSDHARGDEHGFAEAAPLILRQRETASEEVRADRQQVVARGVQDSLVRRAAAEPGLRQQAVYDNER